MSEAKDMVSAAISRAKADLERALGDLEKIPSFDPTSVAFSAHALNNFLSVTNATTDLLRISLKDYPDQQVQDWLKGLKRTARLMSHIVAELMNDATIRKSPELTFERFNLARLVRRACNYYQLLASQKLIRIRVESKSDRTYVRADRVAVAAVMDNLLSNAVKYSYHDREILVTIDEASKMVECSVLDGGPGLSAQDQAGLFQKGVTLSSVPTGNEPATGYGLAVAKELIDLLGGSIWCQSQLGKGACFSFSLPAAE